MATLRLTVGRSPFKSCFDMPRLWKVDVQWDGVFVKSLVDRKQTKSKRTRGTEEGCETGIKLDVYEL